jgi:hypothetical protein
MPKVDNAIVEMAIVGYQSEVARVKGRIADIKERLGQPRPGRPKAAVATPAAAGMDQAAPAKRRTMSKSARDRIAAAQRARWAAHRKQQAGPAKPAAPAKAKKRKFSAAGLKAIREATQKRWAAYRKAKKAAA